MFQRILLFLSITLISFGAFAQTGTVRGFVYERSSGEPLSYTNVVLQGATTTGVQTDINGYFSIPQITPGSFTIFTTLVGFDTARATIEVTADNITTQNLYIDRADRTLQGVVVKARQTERATRINVGSTTITPREIKLLPSAGGEPDLAQYLQVVPGVVFTGDQGGQLYIRGGSPAQTGILLDGVTIYNPFHSIGLFSVFEVDAIRNVEVQSAGFSALYGNRTSAILDVRTKDGNKNRLSGKLSASPIMARAMLEGPIRFKRREKKLEEDGGAVTFLLSAKTSYLESASKAIYGGFGEPFKSGLPYSFTDLYGKITFSGDNGSKLNVFGFSFDDQAKVRNIQNPEIIDAKFDWKARGGGATFVVTPGTSAALINGRFAYSRYDITSVEGLRKRTSGINGFEGAIDFTYFLPGYSQIRYGVEVGGQSTDLDYISAANTSTSLTRQNTTGALFALYRKNINQKLIIEPSIRVQYYASLSKISPEPRLGLKYNVTPNVRLKAAGGVYSQNIISTRSDRDIVNFFNGFVLSPDQNIQNTKGEELSTNLQMAYHLIGGIEVDVQDIEFNLEPWYKNFSTNIELNRAKNEASDADFVAGSGIAYGVDLSAKYSKGRFFFTGSASYQKVNYKTLVSYSVLEEGQQQEYPAPFDRRFNTNLVSSYTFGKKKDLELSARYNLGSPFPFTQTQGFYENQTLNNGVNSNPYQGNGSVGVLYARDLNGGRLSYYHRLDLSIRKRFIFTQNSNLDATFSVTNAYDRNNIFYIERTQNQRVYQLPIFPSINVTYNF